MTLRKDLDACSACLAIRVGYNHSQRGIAALMGPNSLPGFPRVLRHIRAVASLTTGKSRAAELVNPPSQKDATSAFSLRFLTHPLLSSSTTRALVFPRAQGGADVRQNCNVIASGRLSSI